MMMRIGKAGAPNSFFDSRSQFYTRNVITGTFITCVCFVCIKIILFKERMSALALKKAPQSIKKKLH